MLPTISDFFDVFTSDWPEYEWTKYKFSDSLYFRIYSQPKKASIDPCLLVKKFISAWQSFTKILIFWVSNQTAHHSWKMEFWECGIADKVLKVIFENTYLWVTFGKSFIFCVFMLTYLFLVLKRSLKRQKSVIIFMLLCMALQ